jgi:hypothetical protein
MKKRYPIKLQLLSSLLLLSGIAHAQAPTLTASGVNYLTGSTLNYTSVIAQYSPGASGANVTWNFSSMNANGNSSSLAIVNANTTPKASVFSSSNIAAKDGLDGYEYYKTSNSALQSYGNYLNGNQTLLLTNPEDRLRFPFTYNNTYTDSWAGQLTSTATTFITKRSGNTTVTADAYGTLILPGATYTNTLRIKYVQAYSDTINMSGMPFVYNYNVNAYAWYKEGLRYPLAFISNIITTVQGQQFSNIYSYAYINSTTGVNDIVSNISAAQVYPNPASNALTIDFNATQNKNVVFTLVDATGRTVLVRNINALEGKNIIKEDVSALSNGLYFAQLHIDGNLASSNKITIFK